jgi:hypothetical protein
LAATVGVTRPVVPIRPQPTNADAINAVLERLEPIAVDRLDVALHLALARYLASTVTAVDVGPVPTIAQVNAVRELRLTLAELGHLVAPEEPAPEVGPDPELAVLVEAIRSVRRPPSDDDEHGRSNARSILD